MARIFLRILKKGNRIRFRVKHSYTIDQGIIYSFCGNSICVFSLGLNCRKRIWREEILQILEEEVDTNWLLTHKSEYLRNLGKFLFDKSLRR